MNGRRVLLAARRWWWLLIIGPLLAGTLGYGIARQLAPTYAATTRLIVGPSLRSASPDYTTLIASERLVATYVELAQSNLVVAAAQNRLGLAAPLPLLVAAVPDTEFIDITVQAAQPQHAADFANAIADQLVQYSPGGPASTESQMRNAVQQHIAELEARIRDTDVEMTSLRDGGGDTSRLYTLEQQQTTNRQTLSSMYAMLINQPVNTVAIIEPAEPSAVAVAPRPLRSAGMAAVLGLWLVLGWVAARAYLDDTIAAPEDVTALCDAPLLAAIPTQPASIPTLSARDAPHSAAAEAFRTLRTNLQFALISAPSRTLLVTSGQVGEGKSSIVANLAWSLAQIDQRVLVIDADLRRPMLHTLFGLPNTCGLSDLLLCGDAADQPIVPVAKRLHLLPSGTVPPNPAEVLSVGPLPALLDHWRDAYDWLIIDTPPVLAVADALVLARVVDDVLLVIEHGRTDRTTLRQSVAALRAAGMTVRGVVINKQPQPLGGYAYSPYATPAPHWQRWRRRATPLRDGEP